MAPAFGPETRVKLARSRGVAVSLESLPSTGSLETEVTSSSKSSSKPGGRPPGGLRASLMNPRFYLGPEAKSRCYKGTDVRPGASISSGDFAPFQYSSLLRRVFQGL